MQRSVPVEHAQILTDLLNAIVKRRQAQVSSVISRKPRPAKAQQDPEAQTR